MRYTLFLLFCGCLCTACAIKVVPEPTLTGTVSSQNNSQTIVKDNVAITIANSETEINSYNLDQFLTSFEVEIENAGNNVVQFSTDNFLLLDNDNKQYQPVTPEQVKQMLAKDSYYLLPFPYVGFYYLEDYEKSSFKNSTSSNLPYYYELYPQDIYTKSFQSSSIIPKAKVSGLVYFKVDFS